MRVVTWNCNGAFRKKFHLLENIRADLLAIQECEDPSRSNREFIDWARNYLWIGKNKNKGVGVFSSIEFSLKRHDWEDNGLELFLPCKMNDNTNLIAVWIKKANHPYTGYIRQMWEYLQIHKRSIAEIPTIICGDFNSNKCWDKTRRWWNHSDVVRELEGIGFSSLYHLIKGEHQGEETESTLYMQRNLAKSYHIDYVFVSNELLSENAKINVGDPADWLKYSDHVPVIFEI